MAILDYEPRGRRERNMGALWINLFAYTFGAIWAVFAGLLVVGCALWLAEHFG
jgi:hypothetical protein